MSIFLGIDPASSGYIAGGRLSRNEARPVRELKIQL